MLTVCGPGVWTKHKVNGLFLLQDVWILSWDKKTALANQQLRLVNSWGLESFRGVFTRVCWMILAVNWKLT